ncbi:MAG: hypothetical protein JWN52_4300 [Actinomycetia bacterium]|nr:hypothetical protein [Actinomycetes bacterium]
MESTITIANPSPELLRFLAAQDGRRKGEELTRLVEVPSAPEGEPDPRLVEGITGGASEDWRRMLGYLATRPDEWVKWQEICTHLDLSPKVMSGVLGAATHRCRGVMPFEKIEARGGEDHKFRMSGAVAELVNDLIG